MDTKFCNKCNIEKYLDQFNKCSDSKIGRIGICRECTNKRKKEYRQKNKEQIKAYGKEYQRKYMRERCKSDPIFKIQKVLRLLVYRAFKSEHKNKRTMEIIGCSPEEFWQHLEKQFSEGMTRENHGKWHIDHIIPLSSAKTKEESEKLSHYTNLQPLWAKDNLSKGDRIL
jgi:hypothetical protein